MSQEILAKAASIRLAIFDVDGVFTDGRITLDARGEELYSFYIHDGYGIKRLLAANIDVAIITGRNAPCVRLRMQQLGIKHIYQGQEDKIVAYKELLSTLSLQPYQVAYVGDDLPDLLVMQQVGLSIAVANATASILATAMWKTHASGGQGAVREVCDLLLAAQNT
jgi:3-deoxy-D-manno-octulosonate 8-phosphate phosphatase (KDO 8-P phosphatase)